MESCAAWTRARFWLVRGVDSGWQLEKKGGVGLAGQWPSGSGLGRSVWFGLLGRDGLGFLFFSSFLFLFFYFLFLNLKIDSNLQITPNKMQQNL
ncbi:hypothetical protein BRADI_3g15844v3 [Brachypodium distachyon]|uniref:Uncharacterized protein n=1 Tax=Brachypodium distachyon TaxID=15368 RepID=A0A2K2CXE0_BRADI|nr:hypothetical protein BRADI_3g15844v3 [Brachypodium distachyon]